MKFEDIVKLPQHKLKKALMGELTRMGYRTRTKDGFIYGIGKLPVMLVAHLDTIHKSTVKSICKSDDGSIIMSPEGIGGDDRAGVYMILEIIKKYRCHVLFCEDEEIGVIGATKFAHSDIKPEVNYIVELDRQGSNDAVFYDCDNREFKEFVAGYGFKEDHGSFTDISVVAPAIGVAAVNISSGYYNAHSKHEYVDMKVVQKNIERVGVMVSAASPKFEYIKADRFTLTRGGRYYEDSFDFERYYMDDETPVTKSLMELPESAYVKGPWHKMEECFGQYYIDIDGRVYEFLDYIELMVEADGYSAFGESGQPFKFVAEKAAEYDVVSVEYARAAEDRLYNFNM